MIKLIQLQKRTCAIIKLILIILEQMLEEF